MVIEECFAEKATTSTSEVRHDSLARGKSVCPKPKQFVLGGRGALGLIPDASWEGGKATTRRKM